MGIEKFRNSGIEEFIGHGCLRPQRFAEPRMNADSRRFRKPIPNTRYLGVSAPEGSR
jgi:hypothetical protein